MKIFVNFWRKRSNYEKVVLGLSAAFVVFCLGVFSGRMDYARCDVCKQTLRVGEHYILDVRTGEILNIADYVDRESSIFWLSPVSYCPQEVSVTNRVGYMRFPQQTPATARYCAAHTTNLNADFLVLSILEDVTVCYAVQDRQTFDPDGRIITKRLNEELNCWELEVQWDLQYP